MSRSQFDIKNLFALTLVIGCGLRFFTLSGSFVFRFFVTTLLATFCCAIVALVWYVVLPMFDRS
jgi:hypothetical protein